MTLLAIMFVVNIAYAAEYEMIDLGIVGSANGINISGHITGYVSSDFNAFLYDNGGMKYLGTLGGSKSYAYGINDLGQVVGDSYTSSGYSHAFLYDNNSIVDLGTLGGSRSWAKGINNNGQIVGWSDIGRGNKHAFLYDDGKMIDLGTLCDYCSRNSSYAYDINEMGQIVGYSGVLYAGGYRAFLYDKGKMIDIGGLSVYGGSCAYAINNHSQIVGYTYTNSGRHAFLYDDGEMIDLGTLEGGVSSYAYGINNRGQIVGDSFDSYGRSHAFLYENGEMIDLGNWLGKSYARAINNRGQIVGFAYTNGGLHAVLWNPIIDYMTVSIDIMPNSDTNRINLSSSGVTPVAILSSDIFDATTIIPETVNLEGARVRMVGKHGKYLCHDEDVDEDGLLDMVCQIYTAQFMLEKGETVAVMEAETFDGTAISGEDTINIVPDD
jgi:probable HAF family extracellular repeat protein